MPTIKHYTNYEEILAPARHSVARGGPAHFVRGEFLNSNPKGRRPQRGLRPNWIAGFTNGEGSFTASLFLDKDAMWGGCTTM